MPVGVPWNTGVTQVDREPVSLTISKHEGLVGSPAVASKPLQGIAQRPRRRHHVIKQADFAQIEIASQREAEAIVLQSGRSRVQKRDLTWDTEALFRIGHHLRRQSRTPKKRLHRYAATFKARDGQTGEAPLRHRDGSQVRFRIQGRSGPVAPLSAPGKPPWLGRTNV